MQKFKNLSIKKRLLLIIMSINIFSLILAFFGFMTYDFFMFRETTIKELTITADVIGRNCVAALMFEDRADVTETLHSLNVNKSILGAWIFTKDGEIFAQYNRKGVEQAETMPDFKKDCFDFENGFLEIHRPILFDGKLIGVVCIKSDLSEMISMLKTQAQTATIVVLLSLLFAFILSSKLQKIITGPIIKLADMATSVTEKKDYSLRSEKPHVNEIAFLVDAINNMLQEIEDQNRSLVLSRQKAEDSALKAHQLTEEVTRMNVKLKSEIQVRKGIENKLEELVNQRTSQLKKSNEKLEKEIVVRTEAEKKIKGSLEEKNLLLGEIHHRVRNNLQVISSLLDLTRRRSVNQEARRVLTDATSKIHTMAFIHSQLYESEDFSRIEMGAHIKKLSSHLSQIYGAWKKGITTEFDCSDLYLSVSQAIPCALVLNEVISNVFKHAYREDETGKCHVSVRTIGEKTASIIVKDDGIGIRDNINIEKTGTLGMKLIRNLVERQLKGEFCLDRSDGTRVSIVFDIVYDDVLIHSNTEKTVHL